MLRWGYRIPFLSEPPLAAEPIPFPSYGPSSIRGIALGKEVQSLLEKGAVELAPLPSPGFYSRIFVVMKASRSWRPVIDLSTLNLRVHKTPFKMETLQSVLLSAERRLDGVHRFERCLLADPHTSGQSQAPQICSFESGFSVQSSVFRSLYGSAGFHPGHGSGLGSST